MVVVLAVVCVLFVSSSHTPFAGTIGPCTLLISEAMSIVLFATVEVTLGPQVYSMVDNENTSPAAVCCA